MFATGRSIYRRLPTFLGRHNLGTRYSHTRCQCAPSQSSSYSSFPCYHHGLRYCFHPQCVPVAVVLQGQRTFMAADNREARTVCGVITIAQKVPLNRTSTFPSPRKSVSHSAAFSIRKVDMPPIECRRLAQLLHTCFNKECVSRRCSVQS